MFYGQCGNVKCQMSYVKITKLDIVQLHIPSISLKYTSQFLHYYNITIFQQFVFDFANLSQRFQTNFFFSFMHLRFVYSDYFRTFLKRVPDFQIPRCAFT